MPVDTGPSRSDVESYAERIGVSLDEGEVEDLRDEIASATELLGVLDDFSPQEQSVDRDYWIPVEDDDPLGAFLARCDFERENSGVLKGKTVAVKDNIAVAGVPMTCGSPLLQDFVPPKDATVVNRLLDAGARIVGKTNMDEFAYGGTTDTMRLRLARNPHDPERMPGFTSSGSAVAVADGLADVALGTDTGGSIRFPAAWCGVVGIKPTRGLVSHYGYAQFAKTVDSIGPLAPTVEETALGLEAIAGEDPNDERTRGAVFDSYTEAAREGREESPADLTIGIPPELWDAETAAEDQARCALEPLTDDGVTFKTQSIDAFEYAIPAWFAIAMTEIGNYFRTNGRNIWLLSAPNEPLSAALRSVTEHIDDLTDPLVESLIVGEYLGESPNDRYYDRAHRARKAVTAGVNEALSEVDAIACPTVPLLPTTWADGLEDLMPAVANLAPFNLSGHPAISVPCGKVDGLPVGLQFVAGQFEESTAFRVAGAFEACREGQKR